MKKFTYFILIVFFSFFFFQSNVFALTSSRYIQSATTNTYLPITSTYYQYTIKDHTGSNSPMFVNTGEGTIIFSIALSNNVTSVPVYDISIQGNDIYQCTLGSFTTYYDNTTQISVAGVECPVPNSSVGFANIVFRRPSSTGQEDIYLSKVATFISKSETTINQQQVVDAVTQSNQTLITRIQQSNQAIIDSAHQDAQQAHQDAQNIKDNTKETNDLIKNDNIDNSATTSNANTWNNKNASNGVITQLLTLPITLLNAIVNGIQTSCSSFNLGSLFGTDIILPCINISTLIGSALFTTIDLLTSGFMIYNISKKLIKIFNDFTNLKSNQIDELYGGGTN